jgi:hypothetical protein
VNPDREVLVSGCEQGRSRFRKRPERFMLRTWTKDPPTHSNQEPARPTHKAIGPPPAFPPPQASTPATGLFGDRSTTG